MAARIAVLADRPYGVRNSKSFNDALTVAGSVLNDKLSMAAISRVVLPSKKEQNRLFSGRQGSLLIQFADDRIRLTSVDLRLIAG
jgi:hypothetical protein